MISARRRDSGAGCFEGALPPGDDAPKSTWPVSATGRLAQLVERHVYTVDVGSSSLSPPTSGGEKVAIVVGEILPSGMRLTRVWAMS